ncbi:Crp/Fnr family transcriptional regulator [Roseateles oligotrophus]|uniref:Crp/Fnr family transcriptional regulator n=1 Tax=Roseateles oligotrophus TaxID=1769250 RepID=A0ABT2YMP5_9BURK|nr:Crp/Fnr family transcriptional regulator [Roseateles oligotrophus]MCV2371324.1 Crp/Fnr family transcriptional regulator [Roseateles oligotrophus]
MNQTLDLTVGDRRTHELGQARVDLSGRKSLSDLFRLMGAHAEVNARSDSFPLLARQMRVGATLFHEGSQADAFYFVSLGWFKCFRTCEDGYQQVRAFAGVGDLLGYDALCQGRHPTEAVAIEDSTVYSMRFQDVQELGQSVPGFERMLHKAISRQLIRHGDVADLMAAVAAEVRLARFLVDLSARMQACGQSPLRLLLRMCRRDIASHLGVAHETVSRSFSAMADLGFLQVKNREVEILDLRALKEFSRSTRSAADELLGRSNGRDAPPRLQQTGPQVHSTDYLAPGLNKGDKALNANTMLMMTIDAAAHGASARAACSPGAD